MVGTLLLLQRLLLASRTPVEMQLQFALLHKALVTCVTCVRAQIGVQRLLVVGERRLPAEALAAPGAHTGVGGLAGVQTHVRLEVTVFRRHLVAVGKGAAEQLARGAAARALAASGLEAGDGAQRQLAGRA